jgi:hypothetical protein
LSTDGLVAACNCTEHVEFRLKREVPSGQRVIFLLAGHVTAEGVAP